MHRVVQQHRYRIERIITTAIMVIAATATVRQHETNRIQRQEFGHTDLAEYLRQLAVHLASLICRGFPFLA